MTIKAGQLVVLAPVVLTRPPSTGGPVTAGDPVIYTPDTGVIDVTLSDLPDLTLLFENGLT